MPKVVDPWVWWDALQGLPPVFAIIAAVFAVLLLTFGLRGFCWLALGLFACLGAFLGQEAAATLGAPSGLVGMGVALAFAACALFAPALAKLCLFAYVWAVGAGVFVFKGLELQAYYWPALGVGCIFGVVLLMLGSRFAVAVICAILGTFALLSQVAAFFEVWSRVLIDDGLSGYPEVYVAIAAVLTILSLIVQVGLDPDDVKAPSLS